MFDNIYVFITHTHPDHIGSLGDLIYYNHFILKKKLMVISISNNIESLLESMGVKNNFYELSIIEPDISYTLNDCFLYEAIQTKHYEGLKSSGFKLKINDKNIYYSGDACNIPEKILQNFLKGNIDEIYQDTCDLIYDNNPHFAIDLLAEVIPKKYRHKVFCMHIDEHLAKNSNKITKLGFNKVTPVYKNDLVFMMFKLLPSCIKKKLL